MTAISYPSYKSVGSIRTAAILTGSFVVAKTWGLTETGETQTESQGRNIEASHLILDLTFTKGSLTTAGIKLEYSDDGATWFVHTSESTSAGVSTVSLSEFRIGADGNYSLAIPLIKHPYMRVSAIGNGTATGSSLAISARFIS